MTDRISTDELRKLMAEATPGPWVACEGVVRTPDGALVSYANGNASGWLDDNARLIAAAPDLAAEVIRLREALSEIWLRHIPDQPAAYGWSERDWVVRQHTEIRRIARAALNHKETDNGTS